MLHEIWFSGINKDIWVVGSSIIQRAGEHSKMIVLCNEWVLNSSGL
jgi:hypothetical protein